MTVYVKTPIEKWSKDEHEEKRYNVVFPDGDIYTVFYDKHYGLHDEFTDCSGITHVLEEVEIPTAKEWYDFIESDLEEAGNNTTCAQLIFDFLKSKLTGE